MPIVRILGDEIKFDDKIVASIDAGKSLSMALGTIWAKAKEKVSGEDLSFYQLHAVDSGGAAPTKANSKCGALLDTKKSLQAQGLPQAIWLKAKEMDEGASKKGAPKAPKPAAKPAEKPAEKPKEKPAEKPAEKPKEKPAEKPAEKPKEKPAEKPAEKPKEKPAEKPAEKPKEKPEAAPAAKPAEKPKEAPKESKQSAEDAAAAPKAEKEEKKEEASRAGYSSQESALFDAARSGVAAVAKEEGIGAGALAAVEALLRFGPKDEVREALKAAIVKAGKAASPKAKKEPKAAKEEKEPKAAKEAEKKPEPEPKKEEPKKKEEEPKPKPPAPAAAAAPAASKFKVGDAVAVCDDGEWDDGVIKKVRGDGTYDVDIAGDLQKEIPEEDIKAR